MEQDLKTQIEQLTKKIDAVYVSSEKTRKYFLITMWLTLAVFVLPLVGLAFVVPSFMNTYVSTLSGGGN